MERLVAFKCIELSKIKRFTIFYSYSLLLSEFFFPDIKFWRSLVMALVVVYIRLVIGKQMRLYASPYKRN